MTALARGIPEAQHRISLFFDNHHFHPRTYLAHSLHALGIGFAPTDHHGTSHSPPFPPHSHGRLPRYLRISAKYSGSRCDTNKEVLSECRKEKPLVVVVREMGTRTGLAINVQLRPLRCQICFAYLHGRYG
jgi:hypothetical protein